MRTYTVTSKVTAEEREVTINISCENGEWVANLYTCIEKYANKCKKQGWKQIDETRHTDGTFIGATFIAPLVLEMLTHLKELFQKNINKSF